MEEIVRWLKDLINMNTTCDCGDEALCAAYIAEIFRKYGIPAKLWKTDEKKASVAAWISGTGRDTLILHAHMDTAPYMETEGWKVPPDRASVVNECICGRGALDCKGQLAVWMKIMADLQKTRAALSRSVLFLATADEENGGGKGLGWLEKHTDILDTAFLAIGEGGGYPLPCGDEIYYTFQMGERIQAGSSENYGEEDILRILDMGIGKGYYSAALKDYYRYISRHPMERRRLDMEPLYAGMEDFFEDMPPCDTYEKYGELFQECLRELCPGSRLVPVITPGYSDNRYFRARGIPVVGFFPLDLHNRLSGIHGVNEYISMKSLQLASQVMKKIIYKLVLT